MKILAVICLIAGRQIRMKGMPAGRQGEEARLIRLPGPHRIELLQARYLHHSFARHSHRRYSIGVIDQGCSEFYCQGRTYRAQQGNLVLIGPGAVHTGRPVGGQALVYRMIYLPAYLFEAAAAEVSGRPCLPGFSVPALDDRRDASLVGHLHNVLQHSRAWLERDYWLCWTLARLVIRHAGQSVRPPQPGQEHGSVTTALAYLHAHYDEDIPLDRLARQAASSPFHLLRTFRRHTGLPPHAYQTQLRIEAAKKLILQGRPLADVAAETGFADQSHFTRRFKQLVGITPGEYVAAGKRQCQSSRSAEQANSNRDAIGARPALAVHRRGGDTHG